ncbi:MAG: restriction endonuclease, partial [Deltaproteobacteria bacterium]|nr:restriction endonuclease [Deltaproteobacteria bacterium]
ILVVHNDCLVAAIEFKSQRGPSFGNNFNNRTEEALGTAEDLWTAYREGAFGKKNLKPWAGWLMLVEDCEKSNTPVEVAERHFPVRKEFKKTSYAQRYELLLRKMVLEKKYDAAAFIMATQKGGIAGKYSEPATDLSMKKFLASLAGHIRTYLESF